MYIFSTTAQTHLEHSAMPLVSSIFADGLVIDKVRLEPDPNVEASAKEQKTGPHERDMAWTIGVGEAVDFRLSGSCSRRYDTNEYEK